MARMKTDTSVTVTYRNPGSADVRSANLVAVVDLAGLLHGPCGKGGVDPAELPVTVEVLPSGIGYIRVNTFADDVTLMAHAWEWALRRLDVLDVPALIVDVRGNGGGLGALAGYFAGSFADQPFVLATEFYTDETGQRLDIRDVRIEPAPVQWTRPLAVLIDADCASACEIFAAAVAHTPDHLIVGQSPSAGAEGAVFPWLLPGAIEFQAPLIAFRNADGSVFLEGVGVVPNVKVPNTPETLLIDAGDDAALATAVAALQDLGAP
jgi:carboxyl-terminal processing protease